MNINFDQVITDLEGKPVKERTVNDDGERGPDRDLTLERTCINALLTPTDEKNIDGPERVLRLKLAERIFDGGEIDLEVEEIAKLKKMIPKTYVSTLIIGKALRLLEKKE